MERNNVPYFSLDGGGMTTPGMRMGGEQPPSWDPDQDAMQTQGLSPPAEWHHTDEILDHLPWYDQAAVPAGNGGLRDFGGDNNMRPNNFTHIQFSGWVLVNVYQNDLTPDPLPSWTFGHDEPLTDRLAQYQQREQFGALYRDRVPRARNSPDRSARGSRETGIRIPDDTRVTSKGVREAGGSCMRCWAVKEKCSTSTPCTRCEEQLQKGTCRKWMQCFRSFSDLDSAMTPSMLASRLDLGEYEKWMKQNTDLFRRRTIFKLPLSFGFGKTFTGFLGSEFVPRRCGSMSSYSVRPENGEVHGYTGIPIFVTYEKRTEVVASINEWLRDTLMNGDSMRQWRLACFPGVKDAWARDLFETVWQTSHMFWAEKSRLRKTQTDCDKTLIRAWYMALLAAILSFQISVPLDKLSGVDGTPLSGSRDNLPNSSRPINKGAKSVLFFVYHGLQQTVLAQLDKVVKNSKTMDDRAWGPMFCVSILLVFAINQAQLSLRANYNIAVREGNKLVDLQQTERALIDLEAAFRAIACSFAKVFRRERKKRQQSVASNALAYMESRLFQIYGKCRDDVRRYRREQIQRNMNTETWFSPANKLRLFAYFLQEMFAKDSR